MSRLDHVAVQCAHQNCRASATIIHAGVPYCGKHALAALEAEERADGSSTSVTRETLRVAR